MYYWRIESDNGLMKVSSPVLNFTTLASGCPSLNCVAGNSLCNQTLLSPACQCLTGWSGTTCATAICASSCGQHGVHCAQPVHLFAGLLGPNLQHQGSLGLGLGPRARRRCCGDCHSGAARRWHLLSAQVPRPGPVLQEPQDARLCAACLGDVTPVTERDEIAKALVYVFEDATCNVAFQRYLVDCEVKIAELESTLFRANGLSKIVGLPYLFRTLALLLNEIVDVANSEEQKKLRDTNEGKGARGSSVQLLEIDTRAENLFSGDMEIDPSKMKGDQDAPYTNTHCRPFLEIFSHLKKTIEGKFPGAVHSAVGGFIFLRFVNPAIRLLESYVSDPIVQRNLETDTAQHFWTPADPTTKVEVSEDGHRRVERCGVATSHNVTMGLTHTSRLSRPPGPSPTHTRRGALLCLEGPSGVSWAVTNTTAEPLVLQWFFIAPHGHTHCA
eukprot:TRINITY_DN3730_c0_g1_i27.p1 TRINITY_DN3730_c0_g1~~TRINITY_DN3730_c0_g1_i27.p1  ORF type:complete len:443 (+),score=67.91 TRINITY_DN3730_c0_g1_i27:671-1999(+)